MLHSRPFQALPSSVFLAFFGLSRPLPFTTGKQRGIWKFSSFLYLMQVLLPVCLFHGTFLPSEKQVKSSHFSLFLSQSRRPWIWRPAVPFPQCVYLNNDSFNFCQRRGFRRDPVVVDDARDRMRFDLKDIEDRILELKKIKSNKSYEKQKSSSHQKLARFLASLSPTPLYPKIPRLEEQVRPNKSPSYVMSTSG